MLSQLPKKEALKITGWGVAIVATFLFVGHWKSKPDSDITFEKLEPLKETKANPPKEPAQALPIVQVSGAVRKPGVYRLQPDARVHDAIREAGGAKPHADLSQWNLAARIQDGASIHIPAKIKSEQTVTQPKVAASSRRPKGLSGTIEPFRVQVPEEYRGGAALSPGNTVVEPEKSPSRSTSKTKAIPAQGSISLNTGSQADLEKLPGVGPSTAQKILQYRRESGGFTSIDELMAVKGIGPKKMEAIRPYVRL